MHMIPTIPVAPATYARYMRDELIPTLRGDLDDPRTTPAERSLRAKRIAFVLEIAERLDRTGTDWTLAEMKQSLLDEMLRNRYGRPGTEAGMRNAVAWHAWRALGAD